MHKIKMVFLYLLMLGMVFMPVISYGDGGLPQFQFGSRLLYTGTYGTDVSELQSILNSIGFNTGAVDGIFGNKTLNGVLAFQKAENLVADGVVGPNTYNAINRTYFNYSKQRLL